MHTFAGTMRALYAGPQLKAELVVMTLAITETVDTKEIARMVASAKGASAFLKAMSNEKRLLILCMLSQGERSVTELEGLLELRQPTVSQQLARLRAERLVKFRRNGKTIYYSLGSEDARKVMNLLFELFCESEASAGCNLN